MVDIRFPNFAVIAPTWDDFLHQSFGYRVVQDSADWIIPNSDPVLRAGPSDVLKLHPQIELQAGQFANIARRLTAVIPDEFSEYQPEPPEGLTATAQYGILSEIDHYTIELVAAPPRDVELILREKILPFMYEKMECRRVTPVTIRAGTQQKYFALAKNCLLVGLYGPTRARELVLEENTLGAILPDALDVLTFVEALTRFSPLALTLPIRRWGCGWHFQGDAMWAFRHVGTVGMIHQFQMDLSPLASWPSILGMDGLRGMREDNIWRFLRIVVDGVNCLMRFLNDLRNFTLHTGEVDFLTQIQAYCAVHLLFADVLALNYWTGAHNRISYAMSALDKIANLRMRLGGRKMREPILVQELVSRAQGKELERLFEERFEPHSLDLAETFKAVTARCFDDFHDHLGRQIATTGTTEQDRLKRLWNQRNLRHGTFLKQGQFETLFLESEGTTPASIATLPFLLMLGLVLDPERFLTFEPTIATDGA